jgi:hypothetical protein
MDLITKLLTKVEIFDRTLEHEVPWETIKNRYMDAPILIAPRWDMEFHVHIDASNLVVGAMFVHNPIENVIN